MSHIEIKLVADTAADLSALIAGLQAQMASAPVAIEQAAEPKPAPKKEKPAKQEAAPAEQPAAAELTDDQPAVTYSDVQAATTALAAAKGRDAAVACLAEFDVKNGKDLPEDQWARYVERARAMAEG